MIAARLRLLKKRIKKKDKTENALSRNGEGRLSSC